MPTLPEAMQQDKCKPRAQRFPIETPVRYRASGAVVWTEGVTLNISRSGVLFRAEKEIASMAMLEIRIVFPSKITGNGPVSILCCGRVVRNECVNASSSFSLLAAAIIQYRFMHE